MQEEQNEKASYRTKHVLIVQIQGHDYEARPGDGVILLSFVYMLKPMSIDAYISPEIFSSLLRSTYIALTKPLPQTTNMYQKNFRKAQYRSRNTQ